MLVNKFKFKGISIGDIISHERFGEVRVVGLETTDKEYVLIDVTNNDKVRGWNMTSLVLNDPNVKLGNDYNKEGKFLFIDRIRID